MTIKSHASCSSWFIWNFSYSVPVARHGMSTFLSSSAKIFILDSVVIEGGSVGKKLNYCINIWTQTTRTPHAVCNMFELLITEDHKRLKNFLKTVEKNLKRIMQILLSPSIYSFTIPFLNYSILLPITAPSKHLQQCCSKCWQPLWDKTSLDLNVNICLLVYYSNATC